MMVECENCGELIPLGKYMDRQGKWQSYKVSRICLNCDHVQSPHNTYKLMNKRVYFKAKTIN